MNKTKIKIWIEKQLTNMNKIWSKCEQNMILANCKSNLRNALLSKICQKLQKFMKFCSNMKQHFHPSYDKYHSNRAWSNSFKSWIPFWNALFDVQIYLILYLATVLVQGCVGLILASFYSKPPRFFYGKVSASLSGFIWCGHCT